VGAYHRGIARPQVADGGKASNLDGSCEYIEKKKKSTRGQPKRGGPPAWGLGEVLRTPNRKTGLDMKRTHVPRAWTDHLVRPRQWKRDMRFGSWNVRRG